MAFMISNSTAVSSKKNGDVHKLNNKIGAALDQACSHKSQQEPHDNKPSWRRRGWSMATRGKEGYHTCTTVIEQRKW